jgi:hypothetical protein
MTANNERRRLLLGASMVEVWEDPQIIFGWTDAHLEGYMDREAWVSPSAVVLRAKSPNPPRVLNWYAP